MNNNYNLGSLIAGAGIVVGLLAHFGIVFDVNQIGQTLTDISKTVGDLAIIYGTLHQYFKTKAVVVAARAGRVL